MLSNTAENTAWINYDGTTVTVTDKMLHTLQFGVAILFGL
jgi:hypothetical protein